jgi:hypothetical protein
MKSRENSPREKGENNGLGKEIGGVSGSQAA